MTPPPSPLPQEGGGIRAQSAVRSWVLGIGCWVLVFFEQSNIDQRSLKSDRISDLVTIRHDTHLSSYNR
jgi:hypothetical protein